MVIERIELKHFRNYEEITVCPHEDINIFFGQNGSGKTNLLEAIHFCALGKSHRINQDLNAVMRGWDQASCKVKIGNDRSFHEIEVRLKSGEDRIKSVLIDQKKAQRLSEMMGMLRCVIFGPEDLSLIKEGPSARRKFVDMMISQISRTYFISLQQYRVALNQRNAILRKSKIENCAPDSMIGEFESMMDEYGNMICQERKKYIHLLSEKGKYIYHQISGKNQEEFSIVYYPSIKSCDDGKYPVGNVLYKNRLEDIRQGNTTLGPQRDDLLLKLNQQSMKLYASQGQMRTGALSLKLAELQIIHQVTGEMPVLLLDDVMSELDLQRRMNLLEMIHGIQTFITCSDESDLAQYQHHRTYHVFSNEGKGSLKMVKEGPREEKAVFREPDFQ